eukprot:12292365-Alexandrium_andersonii.AAC.1
MSASLVGSEMCIRDRSYSLSLDGSWTPCSTPSPWALPALGPTLGEPAVSYTHLTLPTICSV